MCWHSAVSGNQCNDTITHCANWSEKMIDGAVRSFFFFCVVSLCVKVQPDLLAGHFLVSSMKPVGLCVIQPTIHVVHTQTKWKSAEKKNSEDCSEAQLKSKGTIESLISLVQRAHCQHTIAMFEVKITHFPSHCAKHPLKIMRTQHGQANHLQVLELQRTSHG